MDKEFRQILVYVWVTVSTYYFIKHFFPEKPDFEPDSNIDVKRDDLTAPNRLLPLKRFCKFLLKDRAVKGALISIFLLQINKDIVNEIAEGLAASSPSMITVPSKNKKIIELPPTFKEILASNVPSDHF